MGHLVPVYLVLMTHNYHFNILKPLRCEGAEKYNKKLLGPDSLGIEVTECELAKQCGLGNLDPQHSGEDQDVSAAEAACEIVLPPKGARLVTIRPDIDAFVAMAIIEYRSQGKKLSEDMLDRIYNVGKADRFDLGDWPGIQTLPESEPDWLDYVQIPFGLSGLHMVVQNNQISPSERVNLVTNWLVSGTLPEWADNAEKTRAEHLQQAMLSGEIHLEELIPLKLCLLKSSKAGTLWLGYRKAPVVLSILCDPRLTEVSEAVKITISQYKTGFVNTKKLLNELNRLESGWGGSNNIIGSPQGVGTKLSLETIQNVLRKCLIYESD